MRRNTDQEEGYLEVQMDGKQVVIVVVGVLLLCAISFYFGRRIGRAEAAGREDAVTAALDGSVEALETEDAAADLTFFDHVGDRPTAVTPPGTAAADRPQPTPPPPSRVATGGSLADGSQEPASRPANSSAAGARPVKAPAAARPRLDVANASTGNIEIQVGVYTLRASAERLVARLRTKGYRPIITPTSSQGKTNYRVRVGGYATRAAAETAAARLQKEEQLATWIPPQGG